MTTHKPQHSPEAMTPQQSASITDISVNSYSSYSKRAAASWSDKAARYHVWFDTETLALDSEGVIYKNPPLSVDRNTPGHFDTRQLKISIPKNAALVSAVFSEIQRTGAIAKAIAEVEAEERAKQAEYAAEAEAEKLRQSAPALLSEVKRLRAENQRLREELARAAGWMERAAQKEKGAAMTSGYLIRIAAARALAPKGIV